MLDMMNDQESTVVESPPRTRAVQQDMSTYGVDWPVVHSWSDSETTFVGMVSIKDDATHAERAAAAWSRPTDEAADEALAFAGWHRTGDWETDWNGRRTAAVEQAVQGTRIPGQTSREI
jgi:hypothetical protein